MIRSALLLVTLLATAALAADDLREYPDPGYYRLGVYGGGPRDYFDYSLAKMSLGNTFPNKKAYWAERRASRDGQGGCESPHTIYVVYCGIRDGDSFENCRRRLDAWLQPEPDVPTYPETIPAINREWHQFTTCMEFNVSTAPFCVAGPRAMNPWLGSNTPDMLHLRRALSAKRRQALHFLAGVYIFHLHVE